MGGLQTKGHSSPWNLGFYHTVATVAGCLRHLTSRSEVTELQELGSFGLNFFMSANVLLITIYVIPLSFWACKLLFCLFSTGIPLRKFLQYRRGDSVFDLIAVQILA